MDTEQIKSNLREFYNIEAERRNTRETTDWKLKVREQFYKRVEKENKKTLLELGAGAGKDSRFFMDKGLEVAAVDMSSEMVRQCREKSIDAYEMDFYNISALNRKFNCIWAMNSLLHVPKADLPDVLTSINSLLDDDGLFFMGVYGGEDNEKDFVVEEVTEIPRFFASYTDSKLKEILSKFFDIVTFEQIDIGQNPENLSFQAITMRKKKLKKNDIFTAEIIDYTSEGLGVCRHDGQAVFVRGAARGDVAHVRVVKVGGRVLWGRIDELITPSPSRVRNDCTAFPLCGGCDLRHVSYEEELWFKRNKVEQTLKRVGGVELIAENIVAAEAVDGYRNKAITPIGWNGNEVVAGYYKARSHEIVPCLNCKINAPEINVCVEITRDFVEKFEIKTVRHLMVRATDGGVQAVLITKGSLSNAAEWIAALQEGCTRIKSVLVIENMRDDNVLMSGEVKCLWGDMTLVERLEELEFELHPFTFAQVNSKQAVKLYDLAREYAGEYDVAADLYCGTGTLTLWLAKHAKKVYGVEVVPQAVECARRNAERNGIKNVEFFLGDAGAVKLPEHVEVVTVDPPRSGLDLAALNAVLALAPQRIVYVSCDPATLARDVKLFGQSGYGAKRLGIVDMFPRTRHVEAVVMMEKNKNYEKNA